MQEYIGRVVVLLTPVFAGLAGWVAQLAVQYLPGAPALDTAGLTAVFVAGAAGAVGLVWKWLTGLQKHEERREKGYTRAQGLVSDGLSRKVEALREERGNIVVGLLIVLVVIGVLLLAGVRL